MAQAPHDTFDIQGQEEAAEKARARAELQAKLDVEALVWVMQSKRGRRVIYGQLDRAGVYRLSFSSDALVMAFNEGARNEGLVTTAKLMQHCPSLYMQMLKERSEDE